MTPSLVSSTYPLSPLQQGMLFHSLYEQQHGVYIQQLLGTFPEAIRSDLLRDAWRQVLERHGILRTAFHLEDVSEPRQTVEPEVPLPFEELDWRSVPAAEHEERLAALLETDRRKGFDLTRPPLLRLTLIRLGEANYRFLWTFHHALLDGRSHFLVLQEAFALYDAACQGRELALEPPRPYVDFIAWIQQQDWSRATEFWREQLKGFSAPTPLLSVPRAPGSKPTPQPRHGKRETRLSEEATAALKALAADHDLTLNTLVQGAWGLLLARYSGEQDVVFGATRAGRHFGVEKSADMIGLFINTLPVRARAASDTELLAYLRDLRNQSLAVRPHEHTPLLVVQESSEVPRGTSLFDTVFVFENYQLNEQLAQLGGNWKNRTFVLHEETNYPLAMTVYGGAELHLRVLYHRPRFDDATIDRMLGHLQTLLEGMAADPNRTLGQLPLLTAPERHQIVEEWNDTRADFHGDWCIHRLFEQQVERTPDATAVIADGASLTYRELNQRANRLAHYLQSLGVQPGTLVGVCLARSADMIVAVLGVTKAGGAYVPLDPAYPKDRIAFMLDDTKTPLLITQQALQERLPETQARILCIDTLGDTLAGFGADNPTSTVTSDDLAYIIYTSGSTGRPKGVVLRHRPVVNLIEWVNKTFHVGPGDRLLFVTSLNFDLSVYDVFGILGTGATLRVASGAELRDPEQLLRILCREPITFWDSAPPQLQQLAPFFPSAQAEPGPRHLRLVFLSGDWIPVPLPDAIRKTFPSAEVVSLGGATEASIWSNFYRIGEVDPTWPSIPYGKPIQNARYHVLDSRLEPVPVGVVGELHIGGGCLAEGYLNREELTRERFIPDPFRTEPGARLYKTGDLARYFPDGNLEFLGRMDNQVKIRGYRIELGEIEAVIGQHPAVRESVVMARKDAAGDRYLAAYVIPRAGETYSADDLRRFLQDRLPSYMVPPYFVPLDAFPLSPNGKIDRKALPEPDRGAGAAQSGYVAPRDPTEEVLAGIWEEVLGVKRPGIHDDFFALGGHSLKAAQVVARIRQRFRMALALPEIFQYPTIAGLSPLIRKASANAALTQGPVLRPIPGPRTTLPTSFAQQRLWLFEQMGGDPSVYNVAYTMRMSGALDADRLRRALQALVERHETLRTTFPAPEGQPVQQIAAPAAVELPVIDLSGQSPEEQKAALEREVLRDSRQRFDFANGPLWSARLLRLAPDDHRLVLTLHHIITDGWSMWVLFRDLQALYETDNSSATLPPLPIQYGDYGHWRREWMRGDVLAGHIDFWKKRLGGSLPVLQLPTSRPRPQFQTFAGAVHTLTLPPDLIRSLEELSRREGATLFMSLLAGFNILLSLYTNQDDIVLGTPVGNRNQAETENLIGFFVNTLVMRTDLSDNPTFRQFLHRVREETLQAYAHQELPFDRLVQELRIERDPSRNPVFQVLFNLLLAETWTFPVQGGSWTADPVWNGTAMFDLTLNVALEPQAVCTFEYNTDLFDADFITRLAGHFRNVLETLVANPELRPTQVPLLAPAERREVLSAWNATEASVPREQCIHNLFEAQAERVPDRPALVHAGKSLTYRELNARANRLAHHLRKLGVGPDMLVGLCLERSPELIVGMLGILKAGGAYVPLDTAYPRDRLTHLIQDSGMTVLLTHPSVLDRLPPHQARTVLLTDELTKELASLPDTAPASGVKPQNLAYVIYTSGSTGQPKGVLIEHASLVNYIYTAGEGYEIKPEDRVLQFASISFDASAEDIHCTLTRGATLVLRTPTMLDSVMHFLDTCRDWGITVLDLPTAYWHEVVAALSDESISLPSSIRLVIIGGEKALPERLALWKQRVDPRVRLVNTYGPTETTIVATLCDIAGPKAVSVAGSEAPIGRPVANARAYVLTKDLQPVPAGVPGELCIGGAGLARGYHNQPAVTAEKFLPDPFRNEPGARLYRTGDRVRWRADGILEYLDRIDFQVKVRGFRVELGEIETALGRHPAVRDVVVLARADESGHQALAAYIVPREPGKLDLAELRRWLGARLPGYMVPAHFLALDALPLTPNGKIDRKALPAPDRARLQRDAEYAPPRNPTEETLVKLWTEVLGLPHIGIHEDFFALGGHSLNATQVVSRIRRQLSVELPVQALFASPTIAGLAEVLEKALVTKKDAAPALTRLPGERTKLTLSFAQQRLWVLDQIIKERDAYNIPEALRIQGRLNRDVLRQALEALTTRHESLRTTFAAEAGQPVQVIAPHAAVELPLIDLSGKPAAEQDAEVKKLMDTEGRQAFDLAAGPLWAVKLIRLAPEDHLLLLTMHHIISDGWSVGVFYRDLTALYEALASESPVGLPPLPIQYADYASWQRRYLQEETLQKQLDYWKRRLAAPRATLELPMARTRPVEQTYHGAVHSFELPRALTEAIFELSRREGATPFMTLLAAFQTLLYRYSGQEDVHVGTPIAGRNQEEIEEVIGFFLNMLVLRTDLSGDPSFRELLGRVRERTLEAFAHQDVPFERLVEELHPPRDPSRHPLFQVVFNYLQEGPQSFAVDGATWSTQALHNGVAKFDLTLVVEEGSSGLHSYFEYNTDLFDAATLERMAGHLRTLLEGIVARPEEHLSRLPILTQPERHQLLVEWNATAVEYPRDRCMHQLFEDQAARVPDRPAVLFEKQQLTYAELNGRANQLARHLRSLGVGPDVPVGVYVERSTDLVLGGLAVLKAGGAYVPLDPAFPEDRLAFYVEDSRMPVLVTQQRLAGKIPTHGAKVVQIDADWETIATQSGENLPATSGPENLAYMIFTSGSTGKPKGVQVLQKALTNFLHSMRREPGLVPDDVLVSVTTMSFDIHALELWLPLTTGARVVVVGRDEAADGSRLLERMNRVGATVLQATPATWRLLLAAGWEGSPKLKALCGGEPMTVELAQQLLPRVAELWNMYGPTETTVWSTVYKVLAPSNPISIGRPIDNTTIYVLDAQLNPVPIGVAGELHIGGDGVARGYLNRPELTAEKFIVDPFSSQSGARIYKTGDLARYRPDGNLDCLGRLDHQVKVRGFRIELGEIETLLGQHPGVKSVVVVARKDEAGADYLAAYLLPRPGQDASVESLRRHLAAKVPAYMVPSYFITLDAFPLTPNGKIDRKALPAPNGQQAAASERERVAPRSEEERDMAAVWEEVLKVKPIGVTDNFFDLGGHSFLAAVLISRIRQRMGHTLALGALFAAPTVEKLSAVLSHNLEAGTDSSIVPLHTEGSNPPLFMIAGVGGHVFTFHKFARMLGGEQPVYGVKAIGVDGTRKALDRLEDIAASYIEEIRAVRPDGPIMLAGYSIGAIVAYEVALQMQRLGREVKLLVAFDALAPGYPKKLPLPRRLVLHGKELLRRPWPEKVAYLKERYGQAKARVRQALGLGILNAPEIEGVGDLPQTAIKEVWAGMITAIDRYRPQGPWRGPLLLYKAQQRVQWAATVMDDPDLGWGELLTGPVTAHVIPGGHTDVFHEGNIDVVADTFQTHVGKLLAAPVSAR